MGHTLECTCFETSWFVGDNSVIITLTCPIDGPAEPGIIPVELSGKKEEKDE